MPLQDLDLDDRQFVDLYNEALRRIPAYTPEWTDYNDSDPGVTFLQLAAYLQEILIYRLNQVPLKNYQKFMELVGLNLLKSAPAHADLTFTLSKGAVQDISAGTQVLLAGGSAAPLIFETDVPLTAVGINLVAVQSFDGSQFTLQTDANAADGPPGYAALSNTPQPGAALYLGFDQAFPAGTTQRLTIYAGAGGTPAPVLAGQNLSIVPSARLVNGCVQIIPGVQNPLAAPSPPVQAYWEYWAGSTAQWRRLALISDTTQALMQRGAVTFTAPADLQSTQLGLLITPSDPSLFWIRYRIDQLVGSGYDSPPMLEGVLLNTVPATNAVTAQNILLGASNGRPNQTFQLPLFPVLPYSGVPGIIAVDEGDGAGYVTWTEVEDFAGSEPNDKFYTLDYATGLVSFGDGLKGAIPRWLSGNGTNTDAADLVNIKATSYQYGGGAAGNAAAGAISTLLTPIPFVQSVTNLRPSYGGADEETVAQAQVRAPMVLRTSNRAVTGGDFAFLALQTPGAQIARAQAFPLLNPNFRVMRSATGGAAQVEAPAPGTVTVVVVPQNTTSPNPVPNSGTLQLVAQWLDQFRLLTAELYVVAPSYRQVVIQAQVVAQPTADASLVEAACVNALLAYFNPFTGGPSKQGWDFGGTLYFSETYRQILDAPGVLFVVNRSLKTFVDGVLQPDSADVPLQPNELAYSVTHDITVSYP